jgi:hypothetical protein
VRLSEALIIKDEELEDFILNVVLDYELKAIKK